MHKQWPTLSDDGVIFFLSLRTSPNMSDEAALHLGRV